MSRIVPCIVFSFATWLAASGQPAAAPSIKSLSLESIIPIDSIDATVVPSIPADVLAAVTSGAMEIHQQSVYDASAKTLKVTGFLERSGAAVPTPANTAGLTPLWSYTIAVDRVAMTAKPSNALVFVGSVADGPGATPFGDISGSLVTFSTGYKTPVNAASAPATAFSGISTSIAGSATLFSKTGSGTIGIGGATSGGMPTAVAGPKNFISLLPQFQLDASKSTDPSGGALTYHWAYVPVFGMTAALVGADTATPTVTVPDYLAAQGDYTFQLTVTNAAGLSSTDTVVVTYSVN